MPEKDNGEARRKPSARYFLPFALCKRRGDNNPAKLGPARCVESIKSGRGKPA